MRSEASGFASVTEAGARPLALFGYLGGRNLGDDLMLDGLLELAKACGRPLTILAREPDAVSLPDGIVADVRPAGLKAAISVIARGGDLVRVGGTSFHDEYVGRSMTGRYTKLAALYAAPRLFGGRSAAFGVGAGHVEQQSTRRLAKLAIEASACVIARDPQSAAALRQIAPRADVLEGVDLASFLPAQPVARDPSILGVSILDLSPYVRDAREQDRFWLACARAALAAGEARAVRLFIFKDNEIESDRPVSQSLARALEELGVSVSLIGREVGSTRLRAAIAECGSFLATRYHAALLAAGSGARTGLVAYNAKLRMLASDFGLPQSAIIEPGVAPSASFEMAQPDPSADYDVRKARMAAAILAFLGSRP